MLTTIARVTSLSLRSSGANKALAVGSMAVFHSIVLSAKAKNVRKPATLVKGSRFCLQLQCAVFDLLLCRYLVLLIIRWIQRTSICISTISTKRSGIMPHLLRGKRSFPESSNPQRTRKSSPKFPSKRSPTTRK